jgi:heat-inducible transcriptional repressor
VSEYIESGQPVGSGHVTGLPGVQVSSATVRSEMVALEREGFLVQPHTSAGRIPTDKGYRFFVDHLANPGELGQVERRQVRQLFARFHGEVEDLLERTTRLLTNLTDYAAVAVSPARDVAEIRFVQLVRLQERLALLVVVLADGAVEKRTLELAPSATDADLAAASASLSSALAGVSLHRKHEAVHSEDPGIDALMESALVVLGEMGTETGRVFVGGSSRMAAAFEATDTVRSVLSILEQQLVVVQLVEELLDRGLAVAIGTELGYEPLAACALVLAPVEIDGETAGTIGVVGPTRMNYPRALSAVRVVGQELAHRLEGEARARW